ncbi:Vitamin K-dependent protein S [Acropora cervicornis]|uniref:Vitamin K-dependent protein S n=1 Tax=Acropora cervicornis TaxID=6130 RepID=A0AAD9V5R4_ACRCE|nr:Vitamin K-dependent protein S [Acropora cervicornis]
MLVTTSVSTQKGLIIVVVAQDIPWKMTIKPVEVPFIDLLFCSDINECDHADKSCGNASCINTPGSFECHCPHGYEFDDELPACKDVNECRSRKHACDQVCTNTEGSFMCSCHAGYIVSNDSKSCQGKLTSQLCRIHFKTS